MQSGVSQIKSRDIPFVVRDLSETLRELGNKMSLRDGEPYAEGYSRAMFEAAGLVDLVRESISPLSVN